eukprot:scaffold4.g4672.t1
MWTAAAGRWRAGDGSRACSAHTTPNHALSFHWQSIEDLSLPALFAAARAALWRADELPPADARSAAALALAGSALAQAAAMVDALALFSPNEELEDVATSDLRYLLIPFHQAEVAERSRTAVPAARATALEHAACLYHAFLHRLRQYGALSQEAAAVAEAADAAEAQRQEAKEAGGGRSGSAASLARPGPAPRAASGPAGADPAVLRQQKIAKFKREKFLAARVAALEQQEQQGQGGGLQGGDGAAAPAAEGNVADADERSRELWTLRIEQVALQVADRLGSLRQEVQLLRHAASLPEDERQPARGRGTGDAAAAGDTAGPPPPAMLAKLREAVGTLQAGRREQLRQEVLRPSHILPTMTVEQWGEVEYRMALGRQQRDAAAQAAAAAAAKDESEEAEEAALRKQRAWDDWLDDNPRGWGNSKLRPCG